MRADKKLFELGGDQLKKALQAQVDAGKITAAQMKDVVKISDTRTTDQRIDESNKYLEDIRNYTFMSEKQGSVIAANSKDALQGSKNVNANLLKFSDSKRQTVGGAQMTYDALTGITSGIFDVASAKVNITKEKTDDLLFIPGMGTTTGGYGDLFELNPNDGVAAGPKDAIASMAKGGGSSTCECYIDYDKLAASLANVKVQLAIDPVANAFAI